MHRSHKSAFAMLGTSRGTPFICKSCMQGIRNASAPGLRALERPLPLLFARYSTASTWNSKRHEMRKSVSTYNRRTLPLSQREQPIIRSYSTDLPTSNLQKPASKGFAPVPNRGLVYLSGPDAAKFLQGLITNNVSTDRDSPFYSAFLDARGRVLWDVFVWTNPEMATKEWACYIEVDVGEVEALQRHLKKHKLRSKIRIETVNENEMGIYSAWGVPANEVQDPSLIASFEDPRAPEFGIRCLLRGNQGLTSVSTPQLPMLDAQQYTIRRYLFGIPEGQVEIPRESALPMECNIDLSNGIDFRKGCYVGQELTIRTKHTGVVRKRILPVELYTSNDPTSSPSDPQAIGGFDPQFSATIPQGTDIKVLDEGGNIKKGRPTGKVMANMGNVGLALCRLEMMTSMRISAEGGTFREGMQFGVEAEGAVLKVRPIVTDWLYERERNMWGGGKGR